MKNKPVKPPSMGRSIEPSTKEGGILQKIHASDNGLVDRNQLPPCPSFATGTKLPTSNLNVHLLQKVQDHSGIIYYYFSASACSSPCNQRWVQPTLISYCSEGKLLQKVTTLSIRNILAIPATWNAAVPQNMSTLEICFAMKYNKTSSEPQRRKVC